MSRIYYTICGFLRTGLPQALLGNPKPSMHQMLYLMLAALHVCMAASHAEGWHLAMIVGIELAVALTYLLLYRHLHKR